MAQQFEQQFNKLFSENNESSSLTTDQRLVVELRADLRKRGQQFKIDALNLEQSSGNEAIKMAHKKMLDLVFSESNGELEILNKNNEQLNSESDLLTKKAEQNEKIFPNLSAYYYAQVAKNKEKAGEDFQEQIVETKRCIEVGANIPKNSRPGNNNRNLN